MAYLKATFPKYADGVRVGDVSNSPGDKYVGAYGAFGCGKSLDHAIMHLMQDEMIQCYLR